MLLFRFFLGVLWRLMLSGRWTVSVVRPPAGRVFWRSRPVILASILAFAVSCAPLLASAGIPLLGANRIQ
jgi:hypothetical protein